MKVYIKIRKTKLPLFYYINAKYSTRFLHKSASLFLSFYRKHFKFKKWCYKKILLLVFKILLSVFIKKSENIQQFLRSNLST